MVAYASIPSVKTILNLSGTEHDARLTALNEAVSALLDDAMGRTFGDTPAVAETRVIAASGTDSLALPMPLRSVTSIDYGGTWNGTDYDSPETLAATDYRARTNADGDIWRIDLYASSADEYRVTGVWSDQEQEAPPAVVEAANVLVATAHKQDEAGPTGTVIGPTDLEVRVGNAWNDERVQRAIAAYRIVEHVL